MSKSKTPDIVRALAEPIAAAAGCEVVDVEFVREGADWYLRVFIDKPGGVMIDDCEAVSRPLSEKLDENDPIPQAYMLEVSSPGLERPFKTSRDFEKAMGEKVVAKFYKPVNGSKQLEGVLRGFDGATVEIEDEAGVKTGYPFEAIAKIHRKVIF